MSVARVLLLAGGVRASEFLGALQRSILDLPLSGTRRVGDVWLQRIRDATGRDVRAGPPRVSVEALVGMGSPEPRQVEAGGLRLETRPDASEYRGTGGVLRDLCEPLREDEFIVVGSASQCPEAGQLETLLEQASERDGVTLLVGEDGVPTGLMLIRCRALAVVPPVGFHDLKEQALPQIERASGVHVLRARTGACRPIRSVRSYLDVVRSWQESGSLRGVRLVHPLEERWRPVFAIVEDGAEVARDARLHDSVVLQGGVVESGCTVVRTVVAPGGRVRRGSLVVGQLVAPPADSGPAADSRDGESPQ